MGLGVGQPGIKPQFWNHLGTALEQQLEQSQEQPELVLSAPHLPLQEGPKAGLKPFLWDR